MMQDSAAATRYAQAFVSLAHERKELDPAISDLEAMVQILETQPMLRKLLTNPEISSKEKQGVLEHLLGKKVSGLTLKFLSQLLWKNRLPMLSIVLDEIKRLRDQVEGVVRGKLKSARPIEADQTKRLTTVLERELGKRVILSPAIDPALIGGFIVQFDSFVFDGSTRNELDLLHKQLAQANSKA